ncbi:MAG: homoserine O-acetyltransferase family protein [Vulcanimicrobiaceae bacterium]
MLETTIAIGRLDLVGGGRLKGVEQRVTRYGELNADASNAVLVPHALTGSSRVAEWWSGLIGAGELLDPREWCVIGINALGSCYGSTGPVSPGPDGEPYGARFPTVTVRDLVAAQARVLERLGIERLALVIGGSLGGMQALQWALDFPERVARAVMVGSHDHHSAMGIALNAVQREAIAVDGCSGIRIARKIAMLSYKSDELLKTRHGRRADRLGRFRFDVEGYLEHQADLFEARMDPQSYVALTQAMDSFDVRDEFIRDTSPQLQFIGISSDWLFLPQDVRAAAQRFDALGFRSQYRELQTDHGHDAFLAEPHALANLIESPTFATSVSLLRG